MRCPKCDAEIISGATHCDSCGAYVGAASRRSRTRNIIILVSVIVAVVVIFFASMSGKLGKNTSSNTDSSSSQDTPESEELVVYNKNGIVVTYLHFDSNIFPSFVFRVENNSDYNIYIDSDDESVNDYMISTSLLKKVAAKKKATASMTFFSSDLTDNNITTIEKLEFTLKIDDADDYGTSPIDDKVPVAIRFK